MIIPAILALVLSSGIDAAEHSIYLQLCPIEPDSVEASALDNTVKDCRQKSLGDLFREKGKRKKIKRILFFRSGNILKSLVKNAA